MADSSYERLSAHHKLKLPDAVAQSIGFMGPVFSIAFLVPLLVGVNAASEGAGGAAPLAVLVSAIGIVGLAVAMLVRGRPQASQAVADLGEAPESAIGQPTSS